MEFNVKRRLFSALLVGAFMIAAPIVWAMEEKEEPGQRGTKEVFPFFEFPLEVVYHIVYYLDVPSFFTFRQTSKTAQHITSDPRFYLKEKPEDLIQQVKALIDEKHRTIHLSKIFAQMARTKNAGTLLWETAEKIYGHGYALLMESLHEPRLLTEAFKTWQPCGLLYWLAECAGSDKAAHQRSWCKSMGYPQQETFERLLPSKSGLDGALFDSYKLTYKFFKLSKKLAQTLEDKYINLSRLRFRDILEHVSGVSFLNVPPDLDDETKKMVDYFQKKERDFCEDEIKKIQEFLGKRKNTPKEALLKTALKSAVNYAEIVFLHAVKQAPDLAEKVKHLLKLGTLQERAGAWSDAAETYDKVAKSLESRDMKAHYFCSAGFLYEKAGFKEMAAFTYSYAAGLFEKKATNLDCYLKMISLYQELNDKPHEASSYMNAAYYAGTRERSVDYALKAAALYQVLGDKEGKSRAYTNAAHFAEDSAQSAAYALKSTALFED